MRHMELTIPGWRHCTEIRTRRRGEVGGAGGGGGGGARKRPTRRSPPRGGDRARGPGRGGGGRGGGGGGGGGGGRGNGRRGARRRRGRPRLRAAVPRARRAHPQPRAPHDGAGSRGRRHPGRVRARLEQAGHVPGRGGVRHVAPPPRGERDPRAPHHPRHRARALRRLGGRAGGGAEPAGRGRGAVGRLRASDGPAARRGAPGVRVARHRGLSPRGDRRHAGDRRGHVEIAAASRAHGAAQASRALKDGGGTMKDQWTDRLSEYLDGELGAAERAALEGHLATCAECGATLAELRRVVARAGALDDRPPTADLWPAIAEHIGVVSLPARRARRRIAFTVPQLAAASVALALVSSATAWLLIRPGARGPVAEAPTPAPSAPATLATAAMYPGKRYAAPVAELGRALERGRGQLGTKTVRVTEKNLRIINRAIREAQSALAADPANSYLNLHLAQEMRRKLELLRQAAALAGARS